MTIGHPVFSLKCLRSISIAKPNLEVKSSNAPLGETFIFDFESANYNISKLHCLVRRKKGRYKAVHDTESLLLCMFLKPKIINSNSIKLIIFTRPQLTFEK